MACITVAVLGWVRALDDDLTQRADRGRAARLGWLVASSAACGLGVLAKGLIGVVLPLAVIGPWLAWQRRWRDLLSRLHPLALLAFALVVLSR